jgi:hypothetical protein
MTWPSFALPADGGNKNRRDRRFFQHLIVMRLHDSSAAQAGLIRVLIVIQMSTSGARLASSEPLVQCAV